MRTGAAFMRAVPPSFAFPAWQQRSSIRCRISLTSHKKREPLHLGFIWSHSISSQIIPGSPRYLSALPVRSELVRGYSRDRGEQEGGEDWCSHGLSPRGQERAGKCQPIESIGWQSMVDPHAGGGACGSVSTVAAADHRVGGGAALGRKPAPKPWSCTPRHVFRRWLPDPGCRICCLLTAKRLISLIQLAEREGFEPSVRCQRTHTFQACSFGRSDTSPEVVEGKRGAACTQIDLDRLRSNAHAPESRIGGWPRRYRSRSFKDTHGMRIPAPGIVSRHGQARHEAGAGSPEVREP